MLETRSAVDCSHGRIRHELRLLTYFPSLYFSGGGERVRSWFVNVCRMCSCGSGRSAREYVRFKWNHTVFSQGYWRSICPSCNGRLPGSSRTWMCGTFHPRHRLSAQITTHSVQSFFWSDCVIVSTCDNWDFVVTLQCATDAISYGLPPSPVRERN